MKLLEIDSREIKAEKGNSQGENAKECRRNCTPLLSQESMNANEILKFGLNIRKVEGNTETGRHTHPHHHYGSGVNVHEAKHSHKENVIVKAKKHGRGKNRGENGYCDNGEI